MNRILPYSAMNRKANSPLPYSMLKPDTSSDSPSARSNGARFVSASLEIIHIANTLGIIIINHILFCIIEIFSRLKEVLNKRVIIMIIVIVTSYEIVWAIARIEPRRAYFEFDDQPARRME